MAKRILSVLLATIFIHFAYSSAESVCSQENRENADGLATCLQAIRDTMVDISAFWFGTDYTLRCPVPTFTLECQNGDPRPVSMADRLFQPGTFDAATIKNYMDVTMHEIPGTYAGCGHTYTSEVEADHVLNPIDPTPLTPWQAAHGFSASVQGLDINSQYTLVVQDVGFFFTHGIYINIPGDAFDVENGEVIDPYHGPLYYRNDPQNPYIFMLFRQEEANMELTPYWENYFNSLYFDINNPFIVSNFAADQNLEGPVAVNWLMSLTDLFAEGQAWYRNNCPKFVEGGPVAVNWLMSLTDIFAAGQATYLNICPTFVEGAERELDLYHIPNDVPFTTSVNVEYYSVGMNFSTCCNDYSYENTTYTLDPIGDGHLSTFDSRDEPTSVTFAKMKTLPTPTDFIGEFHTLIMIDPDLVANTQIATKEKPFCHWLVTNIPDGLVEQGETLLSYFGSQPPAGQTHRYQFLLYQQQNVVDINPKDYAPECQLPGYSDRCRFEVERFVSENQLTFVGATWYKATSDAYIAYLRQQQGQAAGDVCALIPGYSDPCPDENGERKEKQRKNGGRRPPTREKLRKQFSM